MDIDVNKAVMIERSLQELFQFVEDLEQQVKGNVHTSQPAIDDRLLPNHKELIWESEFLIVDD